MKKILLTFFAATCTLVSFAAKTPTYIPWKNGKLLVSEESRYLKHENGKPFFWQGETGWLMPERLDRDEVGYYLGRCREAGFNVVQVQTINGVPAFNAYGQMSHPDGFNFENIDQKGVYGYWDHMDHIIKTAESNGIYIGMVCIWGGLVKSGLMSVEEAVPVVAAMSVVSGVQSLWLTRQGVKTGLHRLPRFLVPALIGLPVGAWLLNWIDAAHLKLAVAFFMLFYTAFFLLRGQLAKAFTKERPFCDGLAGFTGGVMGGAASLSGVVPTMWCALQPWDKFQTSAVLRPYNVVILTLAFIWYLAAGHVSLMTWIFTAIAFPVTLIFSRLGVATFRRLTDTMFRNVLVALMVVSAFSILAREFLV